MYVKICGLRDARTAEHAIAAGADAIGVVMSERSPRHASAAQASEVVEAIRAADRAVDAVLVVNRADAADAARTAVDLGFDVLQLHGSYSREDFAAARAVIPRVWRAASLERFPELAAGEFDEERLLVDGSSPGSGEAWDLRLVERAALGDDWLLAGGLDPDNVAAAIAAARPAGVDVSSGVEVSPGVKSTERITRFIAAARAAGADAKTGAP